MFINQFKIQLVIALCHALFRSRISGACQPGDIGAGSEACFLLIQLVLRGTIASVETGRCWWGVCLFLLRGTVCLSGDRADYHLAPYVRSCMFTPELSGSIFPMYDNEDSVLRGELSPWIAARLACLSSSGQKPILFCQWVQELCHVHHEAPLSEDLTRKKQLSWCRFNFFFFNCDFIPFKYNKTWASQADIKSFWINSIWIMGKSGPTFCYIVTHVIWTWWKVSLEQRESSRFGESRGVRWS